MTRLLGTLYEDVCVFMIICRYILFRMRNIVFQTKSVDKIKKRVLCSNFSFPKSWCLWDNVEKCGTVRQATDDNIIRRMHFACGITKATDTLRVCNTYCFYAATMVMPTRLNVTCIRTLPVLFSFWVVLKSGMQAHHSYPYYMSHPFRSCFYCFYNISKQ